MTKRGPLMIVAHIAVAALSGGWLVPLYYTYAFYIVHLRLEAGQLPPTSVPFLDMSRLMFLAACIWLMVVIFFWIILLGKESFSSGDKPNSISDVAG